METINLYNVVNAYRYLEKETAEAYCSLNHFHLKDSEIKPLITLVDSILSCTDDPLPILDSFLIDYSIPQIGKEFDLLAIGKEGIVNIELKSTSTLQKRLRQLRINKYYLQAVQSKVFLFSYDDDANSLSILMSNKGDDVLVSASPSDIVKAVEIIKPIPLSRKQLDKLFAPSQYLVSPFNNTDRFLENRFFLTHQQEEFKENVMRSIKNKKNSFLGIVGHAGTGKTLLLYDIVRTLSQKGKRVAILHCGTLNNGQESLIESGWNIFSPKEFFSLYTSAESLANDYDLIAIDEAQRIYRTQFDKITNWVENSQICCLFSFDDRQVLHPSEAKNKTGERIRSLCKNNLWELTIKIRTNPNIHGFVDSLFFKHYQFRRSADNINVSYCKTLEELHKTLQYLDQKSYTIPTYTPGSRSIFYYQRWFRPLKLTQSAHSIIGQEFDDVVAVIGPNVSYNDAGKLSSSMGYYLEVGMLYQILTRTRNSLYIVIYDNPQMFCRCLELLQDKKEE